MGRKARKKKLTREEGVDSSASSGFKLVAVVEKPGGKPGETIRLDDLPPDHPIRQRIAMDLEEAMLPELVEFMNKYRLKTDDFTLDQFQRFAKAHLAWFFTVNREKRKEPAEKLLAVIEEVLQAKVERLERQAGKEKKRKTQP